MKFLHQARTFILAIICCLSYAVTEAQTYYNVSDTSGTKTIAGIDVSVVANTNAATYGPAACGLSGNNYWAGNSVGPLGTGYKYIFGSPVFHFRFKFWALDLGEVISFYLNGNKYVLTSANISTLTATCSSSIGIAVAVNGDLTTQIGVSKGQIDIISSFPVDSIRLQHNGTYMMNGTIYEFYFGLTASPPTITQPFADTLKCPGDSLYLPFSTNAPFNFGNVFTAQLSNSTGNFANPITIGSLSSITGGTIPCKIPQNMPPGTGYRIRILTNAPLTASATNGTNITIKAQPIPVATSNSPLCTGDTLELHATAAGGSSYSWTGPSFTSALQHPTISAVTPAEAGNYVVTSILNGCIGKDTVTVLVNSAVPNPSLAVYPNPNDTLCINNANATFVSVPYGVGGAPQFQWFKNNIAVNGATSITYPATAIADGDSFFCRVSVVNVCAKPVAAYSNKIGMTVLPLAPGPDITITADPGTLLSPWQLVKFTAVATNAGMQPKYQWKRNSQDLIGATSNVWSANNLANGDTISCVVTSDVWCASPANAMSNRMVVNIKTGIKDIDGGGGLVLYPNPNNGSFTVNIPLPPFEGGNLRVDVVDALGRSVYKSTNQPATQSTFEITLPASVANGVYLLKLHAEGVVYHARFTVSR